MNEGKLKRVIIATTVGAVLLLVILIAVMVFQLISIGVHKKKEAELNAQIAIYKELKETSEDALEERSAYWWIVQRARELGYYFDGDKIYR